MTFENSTHVTEAATLLYFGRVQIVHTGDANPLYLPLAEKIAVIFADLLDNFAYLRDGKGNCGTVSAITHAVATAEGYEPRLYGGNCITSDGHAPFGRLGGHYWVEMPDGVVIDGAGTNRVQIYEPAAVGLRMIPVLGFRRGAACMRKTKRLLELSDAIQKNLTKGRAGTQSLVLKEAA